jgi:choice-of-anchor B domain-containing protein
MLVTPANAHDDDLRKILDQQPPVFGPIWTQGMSAERGGFDSLNMTLLSQIPLNNFAPLVRNSGNDCWGYTSPSGREYAIMGVEGGFGFIEITDPTNPVVVDRISGPSSLWHDVKVVGEYAYGVSEGGSGIQVMDMSAIDSGNVTLVRNWTSGGYSTTHNIVTNEDTGSLWIVGGNIGNGGLVHVDISDPELPQFDGGWTEMYVHDGQVATSIRPGIFQGREIAFLSSGFSGGFSQTGLRIVDVTDPNNPINIATLFYPNPGYSHQLWLSEDQKYLYLNDELDEDNGVVPVTTTRIFDVSDLTSPFFVGTFTTGKPSIDHNLYTKGDLIFQANYRSGLRVFDAIDPVNPVEIAYFDTYPGSDAASFNGAWSSYPYFESGNIIVSDIERGLFVLRLDADLPPLRGSLVSELPSVVSPDGGEQVEIKVFVRSGEAAISSVNLMVDSGSGFVATPMTAEGDGSFSGEMPGAVCDEDLRYYFEIENSDGFVATMPENAPSESYSALVASEITVPFDDDMESNTGWSVSGSVSDGAWDRGNPVGGGDRGDPEFDADGSGQCWLTDNEDDNSDVDSGTTILTSPALDASGEGIATLSYALWYSNTVGNIIDDSMSVEVSNNNGSSWTQVLAIGPGDDNSAGGWVEYTVNLTELFTTPSSDVRIRFNVSDLGEGSVVEAGVDAVRVEVLACEDTGFVGCSAADLAAPFETLDIFDVFAYLDAFNAGDSSADFTSDGSLDIFDVFAFLDVFNAGCP